MVSFPKHPGKDTGRAVEGAYRDTFSTSGVLSQVFLSLCLNHSTNIFSEQVFFLHFSVYFSKKRNQRSISSPLTMINRIYGVI